MRVLFTIFKWEINILILNIPGIINNSQKSIEDKKIDYHLITHFVISCNIGNGNDDCFIITGTKANRNTIHNFPMDTQFFMDPLCEKVGIDFIHVDVSI